VIKGRKENKSRRGKRKGTVALACPRKGKKRSIFFFPPAGNKNVKSEKEGEGEEGGATIFRPEGKGREVRGSRKAGEKKEENLSKEGGRKDLPARF